MTASRSRISQQRHLSILGEKIGGLANRTDDIDLFFLFLLSNSPDLMMRSVKGRADEIVHACVNDNEFLFSLVLFKNDACQQNSGIADNDATRLKNDGQAKILRAQKQSTLHTLPEMVALQRRKKYPIHRQNPHTSVHVPPASIRDELANAGDCLFERPHLGDLRSDVARYSDHFDVRKASRASVQFPCFRQTRLQILCFCMPVEIYGCVPRVNIRHWPEWIYERACSTAEQYPGSSPIQFRIRH